jgi:hypothetical protein
MINGGEEEEAVCSTRSLDNAGGEADGREEGQGRARKDALDPDR